MASKVASAVGAVAGLLSGPLGAVLAAVSAKVLTNGVGLHLMDAVMGSLESEATRLADAQKKNGCT
jgi:hypothetical protein